MDEFFQNANELYLQWQSSNLTASQIKSLRNDLREILHQECGQNGPQYLIFGDHNHSDRRARLFLSDKGLLEELCEQTTG
jgi:hypothetical protein